MIVLAHILGVPLEEYTLPWISGAGAGVLIVLASSIRRLTFKRRTR